MQSNNKYIIGIDIGGTTYSSVLFNETLKDVVQKSKKELISKVNETSLFIESLISQIDQLIKNYTLEEIVGIGISCPGPLDSKNGIILETPNIKILQNIELKKKIESHFNIPTYIENDANLFALGEWFLNSKKKDEIFSGITLGTGLGFGIIINGKNYLGAHGLATEYAISPLDEGNWESKVSISAIKKISEKYFDNKNLNPKDIYDMAVNGDPNACIVWKKFGENLGIVLSHFINLIDPHKISVGGGVSKAFIFFEDSMKETLKKHSPAYQKFNCEIFESTHKELSSQMGAALLVKDYY